MNKTTINNNNQQESLIHKLFFTILHKLHYWRSIDVNLLILEKLISLLSIYKINRFTSILTTETVTTEFEHINSYFK